MASEPRKLRLQLAVKRLIHELFLRNKKQQYVTVWPLALSLLGSFMFNADIIASNSKALFLKTKLNQYLSLVLCPDRDCHCIKTESHTLSNITTMKY
jgi:hypothetical protein